MEFVVIIWIVCAFIGYAIGKPKGLGGIGFMLGLLLGFIGVIVVAVMSGESPNQIQAVRHPPPEPPRPQWIPCPHCKQAVLFDDLMSHRCPPEPAIAPPVYQGPPRRTIPKPPPPKLPPKTGVWDDQVDDWLR